MKWVKNLSIKHKIFIIPFVAIIGFLLYLGINYSVTKANEARLESIGNVYFPSLEKAAANIVLLTKIDGSLNISISNGEEEMATAAKTTHDSIVSSLGELSILEPERGDEIQRMKVALEKYFDNAYGLTMSMIDGSVDFAVIGDLVKTKNALEVDATEKFKLFHSNSFKQFKQTLSDSLSATDQAINQGLLIGVAVIIILLTISFSIVYMITRNLSAITLSLKDIAQGEGDLTLRIEQKTEDEMGELVYWFNHFVNKLHTTMGEVISVIEPLSSVAQQLSLVVSESSAASNEQYTIAESVTQSIDELILTVEDVARNASDAASGAIEADRGAKSGQEIVNKTVDSINELASEITAASDVITKLESDTGNVAQILDVIRGIADQTNLLALNAAIEAARAGEQGRGFAVVADEVRTLASRTQQSTQEIQSVIEQLQNAAKLAVGAMQTSQGRAEVSVSQAEQTGETLEQITAKITSISNMNNQIALATEGQSQTSMTMKDNVTAMRSASDTSIKAIQQADELTHSLERFSKQLGDVGSQFKV